MKVAVCAKDKGLSAAVDSRFGRCPYFVIVDPAEGEEIESLPNSSAGLSGGAGPQAAQTLARLGVDVVVLGNVGPKAADALGAAGIKIYAGSQGTVQSVMEAFAGGLLKPFDESSV